MGRDEGGAPGVRVAAEVSAALLAAARAARARAHAPYSGFAVGASVLGAGGGVYAGCNVENASLPVGTCAEAGAVAAMVAAGERRLAAALVVAGGPALVAPCGACRQRLAEFARPDAPVLLADEGGVRAATTVGALLPGAFGAAHLGRGGS